MKTLAKALCFTALAACSTSFETDFAQPLSPDVTRGWNVVGVSVSVPNELTVSEDNSFVPVADIVWHGDPRGDRRAQVADIVREGVTRGASELNGPRPVNLNVQVSEFHGVTPIAREKAPSAVHNITYFIQATDARTGDVISPPEQIKADLEALTGFQAIEATIQGRTQKVRVTDHIEAVTEGWLGIGPDPRGTFEGLGR